MGSKTRNRRKRRQERARLSFGKKAKPKHSTLKGRSGSAHHKVAKSQRASSELMRKRKKKTIKEPITKYYALYIIGGVPTFQEVLV